MHANSPRAPSRPRSAAQLAGFSNHGDWVDAAAPGVSVVSSYVRLAADGPLPEPGGITRSYGAAIWSGTSFAAPRVAAEIATLRHAGHDTAPARATALTRFPVPRLTTSR